MATQPSPPPADKVVEDRKYGFRAAFPGTLAARPEDFDAKNGALAWRAYTSTSPNGQATSYTATVKVFDTDSTDVRALFNAGESDASQTLGATLISRADGTFGPGKLPSLTLSYQSGTADGRGGAGMVKGRVLLVVKGTRLYEIIFAVAGSDGFEAVGDRFFHSFEILK